MDTDMSNDKGKDEDKEEALDDAEILNEEGFVEL